MSTKRYMQALRCEKPDVIPHQVWLLHPEFIKDATGIDYYERPLDASVRFHELFDVDNGGPTALSNDPLPRPGVGKTKDGGEVRDEGFSTVWHMEAPFTEPEQLWNFDPDPWGKDCEKAIEPNYATRNFRWCFEPDSWPGLRDNEDAAWEKIEKIYPGKFTDARAFYCTTFMWGICIFGWDVFLMALGLDPDKTGQALQRISDITVRMYEYFAMCDHAEFICPHDDVCITSGPVISPKWYRQYIWPQYEKIFEPVKKKDKPVIITADGNLTKLAPDMANVLDGFIFESSTPADFMFENLGKDKCLIGGIDVRPLTFGKPADVEKEVAKVLTKGRDCPGYVAACADTIPANVPIENVYAYFEAIEKCRYRN